MTHTEFMELEKFANGLQNTFRAYLKNHSDELTKIFVDYACKVVDIRLDLARIDFHIEALDMERVMGKANA
jgi:hypothetical protein